MNYKNIMLIVSKINKINNKQNDNLINFNSQLECRQNKINIYDKNPLSMSNNHKKNKIKKQI